MAVHNAEKFLDSALSSVRNQDYKELEIIIVDDCSSDLTSSILKDAIRSDNRISVIRNITPLGVGASLNLGISHARGEYIARMDADDVMVRSRIRRQVSFLIRRQTLAGSGTAIVSFGQKVKLRVFPLSNSAIRARLLFQSPFAHPTVMVRSKILKANLYNEAFARAQDYELWSRLCLTHEFRNQFFVGLYYRIHENQSSQSYRDEQAANARLIRSALLARLVSRTGQFRLDEPEVADHLIWKHRHKISEALEIRPSAVLVEILLSSFRRLLAKRS